MKLGSTTNLFLFTLLTFLSSCSVKCSFGEQEQEPDRRLQIRDGARIYNDIVIRANGVKVEKAYLVFADGEPGPDGNIVDFRQPVDLVITFNEGWKDNAGMVKLGVSEIIKTENGEILLNEPDLFSTLDNGVSIEDARRITIRATIKMKTPAAPLTTFNISFRIWDKGGEGFAEGSYKLFSK